jgi:hypothetical protein
MATMRAKVRVNTLNKIQNNDGSTGGISMRFVGVSKPKYDESGLDEDNTYAKFSPSVDFGIWIANPALFDAFELGQTYYVDFIPAES